MKQPKVINVKKTNLVKLGYSSIQDWANNKNNLYIGRENRFIGISKSKWANPFTLKKCASRQDCLDKYEDYIRKSNLINDIKELEGKVLGCWCHPEGCHGHVLQKLFKEFL